MQELMTVMVVWLSVNFGLPASHEHPRVEFAAESSMLAMRRARHVARRPELVPRATGRILPADATHGVHAIYDDRERTIHLPEGWTATSPAHVSILLHEMVHHLQNVAGTTHACPQERERLAYDAQASWLELLGTSLADEFDIDAMTLLVRTRCLH